MTLLTKLKPGVNPIIVKELRSRMRGGRAFITLTAMLVFLAGISFAIYKIAIVNSRYSGMPTSPQVGQALFIGLSFIELILICGIAPAVTASAISGEQEKLTYEMLLTTPLNPASILWGKLVSALSYVFLLLFASIPMASLIFIFGGVSARNMLKALLVLIIVSVMVGVMGLFFSSLLRRSGRATIVTYACVVFLLFVPPFASVAAGVISGVEPPRWMMIPSPLSALLSAVAGNSTSGNSILSFLGSVYWTSVNWVSQDSIPRPIYHYSIPFFIILTLILYLVSSRLVRPVRRWRIGWRDIAMVVILLAVAAAGIFAAYLGTTGRYEQVIIPATPTPFVGMQGGSNVPSGTEVVVTAIPVPEMDSLMEGELGNENMVTLSTPTPIPLR